MKVLQLFLSSVGAKAVLVIAQFYAAIVLVRNMGAANYGEVIGLIASIELSALLLISGVQKQVLLNLVNGSKFIDFS